MSDTHQDKTEENGKGAILPDPVGEDGFVHEKDETPKTPGDIEPSDPTGRHGAKSDGNPYVTGDVRSS